MGIRKEIRIKPMGTRKEIRMPRGLAAQEPRGQRPSAKNPDPPSSSPAYPEEIPFWMAHEMARDPWASPKDLSKLAESEDWLVRSAVAGNKNAPREVLERLLKDPSPLVRASLAKNRNAPPEFLTQLAQDEDLDVRRAVAENPRTPPEVLSALACSSAEWWVSLALAENPSTPLDVLYKLSKHEEESVRMRVARNPKASPDLLTHLAEDSCQWVHENLVRNPNTPWPVAKRFFLSEAPSVWFGVLSRKDLTLERVEELWEMETLRLLAGGRRNEERITLLLDVKRRLEKEARGRVFSGGRGLI